MTRILFVCLGNICRSPTAEGVFRAQLAARGLEARYTVDSAGTAAFHAGDLPDARSRAAAKRRGIDLPHRARRVTDADFDQFDLLLCMDAKNLEDLKARAPSPAALARIFLFRSYDPSAPPDAEVPDPYYGGERGFEDVLDMCERAAAGLIERTAGNH